MKGFLSKNGFGLLFVALTVALILAVISIVPADAANQGNVLFKNRYGTTSTTPIDDVDKLNGVTSNVQTQLNAKTSTTLADTKVNIGNASGVAAPQSVSLTGDVTGSMTNTGGIATSLAVNSVDSAEIVANAVTASEIADATITTTQMAANSVDSSEIVANAVTASEIADSTITATQMALNSVTATDAFTNTVTVSITSANTGADVAVESGSILLRAEKVSGFNNDVTITKSLYPDASNQWIINTDAHAGTLVINGIFWRP